MIRMFVHLCNGSIVRFVSENFSNSEACFFISYYRYHTMKHNEEFFGSIDPCSIFLSMSIIVHVFNECPNVSLNRLVMDVLAFSLAPFPVDSPRVAGNKSKSSPKG